MRRTASPSAGTLAVAVMASFDCLVRDVSSRSSAMHLKDRACSSSEVAVMPFSAEDGLARKVKRMRSCPDKAGSRPPPQPSRRRVEMHSRHSSRARTGTWRESLSTWEMGTKAYSASLGSSRPGLLVIDWSVLSRFVSAATSSFLESGRCAKTAVTCNSWMHGCFNLGVSAWK